MNYISKGSKSIFFILFPIYTYLYMRKCIYSKLFKINLNFPKKINAKIILYTAKINFHMSIMPQKKITGLN